MIEIFAGHIEFVAIYALIPLCLALWHKAILNGSPLVAVLAGAAISMLVLLRPDMGYMFMLFFMPLCAYHILSSKARKRVLGKTVLALTIAFLGAFPDLYVLSRALPTARGFYRLIYWSSWSYLLLPLRMGDYVGMTVVTLSGLCLAWYCVSRIRRKGVEALPPGSLLLLLLSLAIVFMLLSLGRDGPLYLAWDALPLFSFFRVATRFLPVTSLCFALLAGVGAARIVRIVRKAPFKRIASPLIALLVFADLSTLICLDGPVSVRPVSAQTFTYPLALPSHPLFPFPGSPRALMFHPTSELPRDFTENTVFWTLAICDDGEYNVLTIPFAYANEYFYILKLDRQGIVSRDEWEISVTKRGPLDLVYSDWYRRRVRNLGG